MFLSFGHWTSHQWITSLEGKTDHVGFPHGSPGPIFQLRVPFPSFIMFNYRFRYSLFLFILWSNSLRACWHTFQAWSSSTRVLSCIVGVATIWDNHCRHQRLFKDRQSLSQVLFIFCRKTVLSQTVARRLWLWRRGAVDAVSIAIALIVFGCFWCRASERLVIVVTLLSQQAVSCFDAAWKKVMEWG